jgi:hypothetical protein
VESAEPFDQQSQVGQVAVSSVQVSFSLWWGWQVFMCSFKPIFRDTGMHVHMHTCVHTFKCVCVCVRALSLYFLFFYFIQLYSTVVTCLYHMVFDLLWLNYS